MQEIASVIFLLVACLHCSNCNLQTDNTGLRYGENGGILLDSRVIPDPKKSMVDDDVNLEMMMDPEADFGKSS